MNPKTLIKKLMTKSVIFVYTDDRFQKVREIFDQHSFHHIPVLNRDSTLAGIISKEDWLRKINNIAQRTTGKTWTELQYQGLLASDLMTPSPMVLDPDDNIGLAADVFLTNKFHALPIVEDDRVVGLLTSHDLLKYAYEDVLEKMIR